MCKGVHCVDLGERFQTHIYFQNLASIQPRTSPLKFARSSIDTLGRAAVQGTLAPQVRFVGWSIHGTQEQLLHGSDCET